MSRLYKEENFEIPKDELDKIRCGICLDTIFEATGSENCQHIFCAECITAVSREINECPECKETLKLHRNRYFESENINKLKYHCKNAECDYVTIIGLNYKNIVEHKDKCLYSNVSCVECGIKLLYKDLGSHLDSSDCRKKTIDKLKTQLEKITKNSQIFYDSYCKAYSENLNKGVTITNTAMISQRKAIEYLEDIFNFKNNYPTH
jgi:hypothetical protein